MVSGNGVSGDSVSETWRLFSLQDLSNLYDQYRSIQPWLQRKEETQSDKELYQSVEDRKKLVSDTLHLLHTHFTYPPPLHPSTPLLPSPPLPSRTQSGWSLRVYPVFLLQHILPLLLVAPREVPWTCSAHAGLPMDD